MSDDDDQDIDVSGGDDGQPATANDAKAERLQRVLEIGRTIVERDAEALRLLAE